MAMYLLLGKRKKNEKKKNENAHFGSPADIGGAGSQGSPGAQNHEMY